MGKLKPGSHVASGAKCAMIWSTSRLDHASNAARTTSSGFTSPLSGRREAHATDTEKRTPEQIPIWLKGQLRTLGWRGVAAREQASCARGGSGSAHHRDNSERRPWFDGSHAQGSIALLD